MMHTLHQELEKIVFRRKFSSYFDMSNNYLHICLTFSIAYIDGVVVSRLMEKKYIAVLIDFTRIKKGFEYVVQTMVLMVFE